MNTSFYAIEIASATYDERFRRDIAEAQLVSGKTSLLEKLLRLIARDL